MSKKPDNNKRDAKTPRSGKQPPASKAKTPAAEKESKAAPQTPVAPPRALQDHEVPSAKEVANNAAVVNVAAHGGKGGKSAKPPAAATKTAKEKALKPAKETNSPKPAKVKRLSAIDAAAQVLAASKVPMRAIEMIGVMEAKGLWKSPGGKTPEATLYAAIIRDIAAKGKDARFKKHERGVFVPGKGA